MVFCNRSPYIHAYNMFVVNWLAVRSPASIGDPSHCASLVGVLRFSSCRSNLNKLLHTYAFLVLPFVGFCLEKTITCNVMYVSHCWKTRCHLQETFLLQMIKNSLVERQWCHSWSIERKMVVSPWIATFRTFGCNLDININHTKLSKTGVWAKTQLYREETLFVSGKKRL